MTLRTARLLFLASLAASGTANASPLFELAGASTGTGGFNARATGGSAASTYFNPALLPKATQSFALGALVLSDQISLTLDGRRGGSVPLSVGDRSLFDANGQPISNATVPTDWLEQGCTQCGAPQFRARPRQAAGSSGNTRVYSVIGLVSDLIKKRLVLGFYALVPLGDFTTAHSFYNDEREQFFSNSLHPEFYADRMTSTSLAFGAGSQIFDQLSFGISFTLNLTNTAAAQTYVRDPIDYDKLLISTDVKVRATVSPHFGVAYDPLDWLHFSGTVHSEQYFNIDTGISAALPAGQESDTSRRSVHSLMPWTFGVGTAVDVSRGPDHTVTLAGNLRYALWSDYADRHGERPEDGDPGLAFKDVFAGTAGVRYETGALRTFTDLNYQPTPVPPQTGRRNYVDNDRVGAIVGGDYEFTLFDLSFRAGAQAQAHRLLHRHQAKDNARIVDELPDDAVDESGQPVPGAGGLQTNNPGWPGFASEGWILGGALTLALLY
jgi:long-chain fatty acid transport protein